MHKGVHSRGYLPHWDFAGSMQGITFRLSDSLPKEVITGWKSELQAMHDDDKARIELHRRIARYEDAGHGACHLAEAWHAGIVQDALLKGHGTSYKLIEWCIMPNHVHVLIRMLDDTALGDIVKYWKASTAIQINRLLARTGSFWMMDYHDRLIRDMEHFQNATAYIRMNPVKAGLSMKPEDWPFGSAGFNWSAEFIPHEKERPAE